MRDKFSWFASAFLFWMIAGFIGVIAMFLKGFEQLLDGLDEASIIRAGGYWIMTAGVCMVALACFAAVCARGRERMLRVCLDLALQGGAIALGGGFAFLYGALGVIVLIAAPFALLGLSRFVPKPDERPWFRAGTVGLVAATAAVPVILGSL